MPHCCDNAARLEVERAKRKAAELEVKSERAKRNAAELEVQCERERADRMDTEGDALREEIRRLSKANASLTKKLSRVKADSQLSTSSAIPYPDSEDDDDDSVENFNSCLKISVQGAGVNAVNGLYVRSGSVDGVGKYTKAGNWEGRDETFSIYRCQLNDRTRKWFISVVPRNFMPGTNKDIDFYWASSKDDPAFLKIETPPARNWQVAEVFGKSPPPICVLLDDQTDSDSD